MDEMYLYLAENLTININLKFKFIVPRKLFEGVSTIMRSIINYRY